MNRENVLIRELNADPARLASFWSKMRVRLSGCWEWTACKSEKGYGVYGCLLRSLGVIGTFKAHRVAYRLSGFRIPKGLCLMHSCDNPRCINPAHLTPGTRAENNKDMVRKGRHRPGGRKTPVDKCLYKRGQQHHASKMTAKAVRALRMDHAAGMSFSRLAKKYGLSIGPTYRIAKRITWRHVT